MSTYHFGQLTKTVNCFSYPRAGGHFLNYCLSGLFDFIWLPQSHLHDPEAIGRQTELNPDVLYALQLREPGPWRPVFFDWISNGIHGVATASEFDVIVLIRDPIATAYSRYRVQRDRFKDLAQFGSAWIRAELLHYSAFYDQAFVALESLQDRGLLLRWEELVAGPEALERVAAFLNIVPKLWPSFVWSLTRFDTFVKPGDRTFYRSGSNVAWREDKQWVATLSELEDLSFERFGYPSLVAHLDAVSA